MNASLSNLSELFPHPSNESHSTSLSKILTDLEQNLCNSFLIFVTEKSSRNPFHIQTRTTWLVWPEDSLEHSLRSTYSIPFFVQQISRSLPMNLCHFIIRNATNCLSSLFISLLLIFTTKRDQQIRRAINRQQLSAFSAMTIQQCDCSSRSKFVD